MNSPVKINPRDFEYLTVSDQEYLLSIERLYLVNSGKLKHFHSLGPWHQVKSGKLNEIVERVASANPRPCSRGHVKGLWCVQDPEYLTGPKILKYTGSAPTSRATTPKSEKSVAKRPSTATKKGVKRTKTKCSVPRKFQVTPKPTAWIVMEPSKKKNFICDDPPDPTYTREASASLPRSAGTRKSTGRSRLSKASSFSEARYVASPFTTSVRSDELGEIIERVTRPTHASRGGVDLVEKFRNRDYVYGSKPCTPNIDHIAKATISSNGGRDIAEKFESKDYVYGSKSVTPNTLDSIVTRVTKPTVASTGGAGRDRKYTDFVYGDQRVQQDELKDIIDRITKPTVSSRGGIDLKDKSFEYIKPPKLKTNIIIPGLESKFIGRRRVPNEKLNELVERLTKLTPAYKAKFDLNPHVWKDESVRNGPAHLREEISAI